MVFALILYKTRNDLNMLSLDKARSQLFSWERSLLELNLLQTVFR